jgi:putative PIN family toxin of toxin-antitoxin system
MRAVLDTNVIVSATLIRGGNEDKILRAWLRGAFELVLSPEILEEIGRVLTYDKLRRSRWMTDAEVVLLLETLAQEGVVVPGTPRVRASRDPGDDKFLAAAVHAHARYVVTGDKDLLELKVLRGVRIVKPAHFLRGIVERERRGR